MFCPRCGYNNVDTANFCGGCAMALAKPSQPGGPAPTPTPPPPASQPGPPPFVPPGPPPQVPFGAPAGGWGAHPPPGAPAHYAAAPHWSGMAIAGFVLSFFCGLLGLIFSIMGYRECKASPGFVQGEGLAVAGIIISILSMLVGIISIAGR